MSSVDTSISKLIFQAGHGNDRGEENKLVNLPVSTSDHVTGPAHRVNFSNDFFDTSDGGTGLGM